MFVRVSFCNDNMLQLHDELEISRSCDTAVDEGAVGVNNHTEKSKLYLNPLHTTLKMQRAASSLTSTHR